MLKQFGKKRVFIPLFLLAGLGLAFALLRYPRPGIRQTSLPDSNSSIARDLQYLSSDELNGRLAGSAGAEKAAEFMSREFQKMGLAKSPGAAGYLQEFSFVAGMKLGPESRLSLIHPTDPTHSMELQIGKDFMPTSFSVSGQFQGRSVFAGYGISIPSLGYDDYQGQSVRGCFVWVLRYGPEGNNPHGQFSRQHALRYKAVTAREQGAAGIVFIDDQEDFSRSSLSRLRYDADFSDSGIPALAVSLPVAQQVFAHAGLDLKGLQKEINETRKPRSSEIAGLQVSFHSQLEKVTKTTANVVGALEGSDDRRRQQAVVIGAHYDHLGLGENGSLAETAGKAIHNGADDNASGTAGMLELARRFSLQRANLKRTFVFVAFSAEEEGLLGSKYYVNHPAEPLQNTVAMVNLDMVGRMKGNRVIVGGSGSSPLWKDLLLRHNDNPQLEIKFDDDGFGPSDHASFYAKNIPVLFFFTGVHTDYHKPSDDFEKINLTGEQRVVDLIYRVLTDLNDRADAPQFTHAKESPDSPKRGDFRVYLGTIPDYGEDVQGVKLSGVREGSPAEKAGLRGGDIIIECGGKQIRNVYDYTYVLGDKKAGDLLEVVVLRGKDRLSLKAILEQRP
jgi:hypothetical protein